MWKFYSFPVLVLLICGTKWHKLQLKSFSATERVKTAILINLWIIVDFLQIIRCESNDGKSRREADKSRNSIVFREDIFQESPHKNRAKAKKNSAGSTKRKFIWIWRLFFRNFHSKLTRKRLVFELGLSLNAFGCRCNSLLQRRCARGGSL